MRRFSGRNEKYRGRLIIRKKEKMEGREGDISLIRMSLQTKIPNYLSKLINFKKHS